MNGILSTFSWLSPFSKTPKSDQESVESIFQPTLSDRISALRCEIPYEFDLKDEAFRLDLALNRVIKYLKTHPSMIEEFSKMISFLETSLNKSQDLEQSYQEFTKQVLDAMKKTDRALLKPEDIVEVEERDELGGHYKVRCQVQYMNGRKYLSPIDRIPITQPQFKIGLRNYPSITGCLEGYNLALLRCVQMCEEQPSSYITGLLNSPDLNVPSGIDIESGSSDPLIVYKSYQDILRLQQFTFNDRILFNQESLKKMKGTPESKIKQLYQIALEAFENDAILVQNLYKISTQAMMAGITARIHQKFWNDKLGILVSGGGISVNVRFYIKDKEERLQLQYTTLYKILDINSEKTLKQIKGVREIMLSAENLRKGHADQAIVRDFTTLLNEEVNSKLK